MPSGWETDDDLDFAGQARLATSPLYLHSFLVDEIWKEDDSRADAWKDPVMRSRDPCAMLKQVINYIWSQQDKAELLQQRAKLLDEPQGGFIIELLDQHLARREFEQSSDAGSEDSQTDGDRS